MIKNELPFILRRNNFEEYHLRQLKIISGQAKVQTLCSFARWQYRVIFIDRKENIFAHFFLNSRILFFNSIWRYVVMKIDGYEGMFMAIYVINLEMLNFLDVFIYYYLFSVLRVIIFYTILRAIIFFLGNSYNLFFDNYQWFLYNITFFPWLYFL